MKKNSNRSRFLARVDKFINESGSNPNLDKRFMMVADAQTTSTAYSLVNLQVNVKNSMAGEPNKQLSVGDAATTSTNIIVSSPSFNKGRSDQEP